MPGMHFPLYSDPVANVRREEHAQLVKNDVLDDNLGLPEFPWMALAGEVRSSPAATFAF